METHKIYRKKSKSINGFATKNIWRVFFRVINWKRNLKRFGHLIKLKISAIPHSGAYPPTIAKFLRSFHLNHPLLFLCILLMWHQKHSPEVKNYICFYCHVSFLHYANKKKLFCLKIFHMIPQINKFVYLWL